MKPISVIVVNWNAGRQLAEAVASIAEHHQDLVDSIVIVDNASSDDSLTRLPPADDLPFPLRIVRNQDNLGFGAACNQGAASATTPYLLFFNPDARLFADSLSPALACMNDENRQDIGICGIQLIDETGHVARSCARFPSLLTFFLHAGGLNRLPPLQKFSLHMADWDHRHTQIVDHVIGAFFLVRRPLFETLNGFDPRFFVYLEDLDFSRRAASLGYRSLYVAEARAFHAGGGTSRQIKATRLFYALRSRLLYGFKHFSPLAAWTTLLLTLLLEPCSRLLFALLRGARQEAGHTLQAYGRLCKNLPAILGAART